MKYSRKIFVSIFWIVLGSILMFLNFKIGLDEYWSGLGTAFIVIGILQIVRNVKYHTNESYKEKIDTANKDERNKFIGTKAWAWAGYFYVLVGAVAVIVLQILGMKEVSQIISMSVCALLILYWICFLILRKKY